MFKKSWIFLTCLLSLVYYVNCEDDPNALIPQLSDGTDPNAFIAQLSELTGSCSQYFQYLRIDDFIHAKFALPNSKENDDVKLVFRLTVLPFQEEFQGIFLPNMSAHEVISRLRTGESIIYRVDFPLLPEVPQLIYINLNGEILCETKFGDFQSRAIVMRHILKIVNGSLPVFTYNTNIPLFTEIPSKSCGLVDTETVVQQSIPLAYGGTVINRGEYPWLTALFKKQRKSIIFICGGSLVTTKIILSAAHCFVNPTLTADKVTAMLGRYNLTNLAEDGYAIHQIKYIIPHPDYKYGLGFSDADLALLETKEHVSFTKFIKPICLWTESDDVSQIVNKTGVVVGWGSDEDGNDSVAPKKVQMKIVSGEECLRSSPAFSGMTSSRTLCAGNRDGSGPCEGDSGGGLMINRNGVWMLRGIVSLALIVQQRCDLYEYTVYCDIAKHTSWLQNYTKRTEPIVVGSIEDICGNAGTDSRNEHPWLAAIYRKVVTGVIYKCAGMLVSQQSVLAPASCFLLGTNKTLTPNVIRIYLGRQDLHNVKENGVKMRDVAFLIIHPDFRPSTSNFQDNNIALLQMNDPVSFTQYVRPICLYGPMAPYQDIGRPATLLSWIAINHKSLALPTPIEVKLHSICNEDLYYDLDVLDNLCIPSFGDVEGFLTFLLIKQNGRWLLRGVNSMKQYNRTESYSAYADLEAYTSWIRKNMIS